MAGQSSPPLHILLIDDDAAVLSALKRGISRNEPAWQVSTSTDPSDAIDLISMSQPDFVVSDQRMPHRKGTEVMAALNGFDKHIPGLILSGQCTEEEKQTALNMGAYFLPKPTPVDTLISHIKQRLNLCDHQKYPDQQVPSCLSPLPDPNDQTFTFTDLGLAYDIEDFFRHMD